MDTLGAIAVWQWIVSGAMLFVLGCVCAAFLDNLPMFEYDFLHLFFLFEAITCLLGSVVCVFACMLIIIRSVIQLIPGV